VFLALQPLALVSGVIDAVLPCSVSESVLHFSLIGAAIRPLVGTLSGNAIIGELSLIDYAIGPDELPLPIQQSIVEISLVPIAVLEGDLAWPVEALPIDLAVLRTGGDLALPIVVEDLGELDGQHHPVIHPLQLYKIIIKRNGNHHLGMKLGPFGVCYVGLFLRVRI
jgi:hypothetical protein